MCSSDLDRQDRAPTIDRLQGQGVSREFETQQDTQGKPPVSSAWGGDTDPPVSGFISTRQSPF